MADAAHTRVDVMITTTVIIGSIVSRAGVHHVDSFVTLAVVLVIGRSPTRSCGAACRSWWIRPPGARGRAPVRRGVKGVHSACDIRSRSPPV